MSEPMTDELQAGTSFIVEQYKLALEKGLPTTVRARIIAGLWADQDHLRAELAELKRYATALEENSQTREAVLRAKIERLTQMADSAIVHANCVLNFHSGSCQRETWRAMVETLGAKELPGLSYEHPES